MLSADLDDIARDLVSLVVVTDPFASIADSELRQVFDVAVPFKEHFIVNLREPIETFVSRDRRRWVRKSLQSVHVEVVDQPQSVVEDWLALQAGLAKRHRISGPGVLPHPRS